jgi:hypothetical protein
VVALFGCIAWFAKLQYERRSPPPGEAPESEDERDA